MALPCGCVPLATALLALLLCGAEATVRELSVGYYAETCPGAEEIVRATMARAQAREARSVASVMRLQFHDCFVNVSLVSPLPSTPPPARGLFMWWLSLAGRSDSRPCCSSCCLAG
jgi:peroxidase